MLFFYLISIFSNSLNPKLLHRSHRSNHIFKKLSNSESIDMPSMLLNNLTVH